DAPLLIVVARQGGETAADEEIERRAGGRGVPFVSSGPVEVLVELGDDLGSEHEHALELTLNRLALARAFPRHAEQPPDEKPDPTRQANEQVGRRSGLHAFAEAAAIALVLAVQRGVVLRQLAHKGSVQPREALGSLEVPVAEPRDAERQLEFVVIVA